MKKQRFTEEQIIAVLKEQEAGAKVYEIADGATGIDIGVFRALLFRFGDANADGQAAVAGGEVDAEAGAPGAAGT